MKWIKRGCWIAAWGVWVWCGFGLYRELPRDLGPEVCKLPLDGLDILGFLHGENVVVAEDLGDGEKKRISTWNADRGEKLLDTPGPIDIYGDAISLRHGIVAGYRSFDEENPRNATLEVLNLRTGAWASLGTDWVAFDFHPNRPWLATLRQQTDAPFCIAVFDVLSGKEIAEWRGPTIEAGSTARVRNAYWVGDDDLLIARFERDSDQEDRVHYLQHWHPREGKWGTEIAISPPHQWVFRPSTNGRLMLVGSESWPERVTVINHQTGDAVFPSQSLDDGAWWRDLGHRTPFPTLSPDGSTILSPFCHLWSVENRRLLWKPNKWSSELGVTRHGKIFAVTEWWEYAFGGKRFSNRFRTSAIRSVESGELRYRVWGYHPEPAHISSNGSRAVMSDGEDGLVYHMPPKPNWPLLALCQAILALPLIFLWAILRWRRKRHLRLASVAP